MKKTRKADAAQLTFFPVFDVVKTGADSFRIVHGAPVAEMRVSEAARSIGISRRSVYDLIDNGTIGADEYRRPGAGKIIWVSAAAVMRLRDSKAA